jgi:hypothetical protein
VTSPLILRGRRSTARFEDLSVLLDQDGAHRRIPVEAIEEVRVSGEVGDAVEIVLTSAGGPPTVFTVAGTAPVAGAAFVSTVAAALPGRRRGVPRDGAELMSEVTPEVPAWRRFAAGRPLATTGIVGGVALWVLMVVCVAVLGGPKQWIMPLTGTVLLLGVGRYAQIAAGIMRDRWVTRHHGIAVIATFAGYVSTKTPTYRFTDAEGGIRTYTGGGKLVSREPRRIEVRYDPRDPERMYAPQPLLVYVLIAIPAVPLIGGALAAGLWLGPWQLVDVLLG